MGKALALASVTFIVLGTYYGSQRQASEIETRRSVSDSQYESIARNGALAGMNLARQTLAECFLPDAVSGTSAGADFKAVTTVTGDLAEVTSMGSIMGAHDKGVDYTVVVQFLRRFKNVPFEIVDKKTVPEVSYNVETKVIGSEISYGGAYKMPVTLRLDIGGATYEPFGKYDSQNQGVDNRPSFTPKESFPPGTPISISAKSWMKSGTGWKVYMEQDSRVSGDQLVVLRNGDDVPTVAGMSGQASVGDLLEPFTENGKIKLSENQSIYLFELGSKDPSSTAFDLQDMVVLIDLTPSGASQSEEPGSEGGGGKASGSKKTAAACGGYELRLKHYNES